MQLPSWLLAVVWSGLSMVWAASSCSSSFTFDGSSSDMAQQFRNLYDTGATNASALSLSSIPSDVTERLKNHSLEFEKLPPLLQRAVLWDTGYVVPYADVASYVAPYADVAKLVTIYTLCGSGSTMADIAISQQVFYRAECTRGSDTLLPVPNVVKHNWTDDSISYLIYGIHMVEKETEYGLCPSSESKSAMIIPCVAYNQANKSEWCRPSPGSLVDTWLLEHAQSDSSSTSINSSDTSSSAGSSAGSSDVTVATSTSSSKTGLIVGVVVGLLVLLGIAIVVWICIRRKKNRDKTSDAPSETYRPFYSPNQVERSQPTAPIAIPPVATGLWTDPAIVIARIPLDKVVPGVLISQGGYGEVYRGTYKGRSVAIKMLLPALRNDMKQINSFLAEAKIMSSIEHQRLVPFIGVAWDSLKDLCVVTEFMEGGDLRSLLKQFDEHKSRSQGFDADKTKIAMHVAHALTYLHTLKPVVIHRDLKSKNILLDAHWNAKLTDFGASRETSEHTMTAGVGTSLWMAPEVMMGERYDEKADIFSFGVVLTEMDSHQLPYASAKSTNSGRTVPDTAILQKVAMGRLHAQFSALAPQWLKDMGYACLSLDPKDRPSAAELFCELQTK